VATCRARCRSISLADPGRCLLSPACASFDQYRNFKSAARVPRARPARGAQAGGVKFLSASVHVAPSFEHFHSIHPLATIITTMGDSFEHDLIGKPVSLSGSCSRAFGNAHDLP